MGSYDSVGAFSSHGTPQMNGNVSVNGNVNGSGDGTPLMNSSPYLGGVHPSWVAATAANNANANNIPPLPRFSNDLGRPISPFAQPLPPPLHPGSGSGSTSFPSQQ